MGWKENTFWALLLSLVGLSWFYLQQAKPRPISLHGEMGTPFDPLREIRIETPNGLSQWEGNNLSGSHSGSDGITYEVNNNTLAYRGKHYRLVIGDIVRLDDSGGITINHQHRLPTEDFEKIAAAFPMLVWP